MMSPRDPYSRHQPPTHQGHNAGGGFFGSLASPRGNVDRNATPPRRQQPTAFVSTPRARGVRLEDSDERQPHRQEPVDLPRASSQSNGIRQSPTRYSGNTAINSVMTPGGTNYGPPAPQQLWVTVFGCLPSDVLMIVEHLEHQFGRINKKVWPGGASCNWFHVEFASHFEAQRAVFQQKIVLSTRDMQIGLAWCKDAINGATPDFLAANASGELPSSEGDIKRTREALCHRPLYKGNISVVEVPGQTRAVFGNKLAGGVFVFTWPFISTILLIWLILRTFIL